MHMKQNKDEFLDPIDTAGGDEPAPAPGGEAAPEAAPDTASAEGGKKLSDKPEAVALRQAREEAKQYKKDLEELRGNHSRLEERTNKILEWAVQGQQPQQQQEGDPDPEPGDDDPLGQLAWQRRQLANLQQHLVGRYQQEQQLTEEQRTFQTAFNAVNQRWAEQSAQKPELQSAYNHVLGSYAQEFAANGTPGMTAQGTVVPGSPLDHSLKQHEATVIAYCYQNNIPIEDYLLYVAAARGWRAPQGQEQQETPEQTAERERDERGRFVPKSEDRTAQIAQSQNANRSLSQGSGAPTKKMTAKELAEMSEEDMWKTFKREGSRSFDREMNFR
jgi:hypothetical protein